MNPNMTEYFSRNGMARTHWSRWMVACVGLALASGGAACNRVGPIPADMLGEWQGSNGPEHKIIVGAKGLSSTGIICTQAYTYDSLSCNAGQCTWKSKYAEGSFSYDASTKKLTLQTSSHLGACQGEGLSGSVSKVDPDANKIPAPFRGTWFSCDNKNCGKIKLVLTERGVTLAGNGPGECYSGDTSAKTVTTDGPRTKIEHGGLSGSGFSFTLLKADKGGFELIGASSMNGTYGQADCVAGTPEVKKKVPASDSPTAAAPGNSNCLSDCIGVQTRCINGCSMKQDCVSNCMTEGQRCGHGCI
jgi:hypothetical protein